MDDVARRAGLSRQGLYLHFATKDLLFAAVVDHLVEATLEASRAAMDDAHLPVEDRLHRAFLAMYDVGERHGGGAHLDELLITASQLVPEVLQRLDNELATAIAGVLKSSGVVDRWKGLRLTPRALAENLLVTSNGLKHAGLDAKTYGERMRIAVYITCRAVSPTTKKPVTKNTR